MCKRFSSALLLGLLLPGLVLGDGGYLMDQSTKDESLRILTELEQTLQEHKTRLIKAIENATKLDESLTQALSSLETSEINLREAKQKLADSEAHSAEVSRLLTQASQALTDSEKSFKAYQQSEFIRLIGVSIVAFAIGLLTGLGLSVIL